MDRAKKLRTELTTHRERAPRGRYPAELREAVIAYLHERAATGVTVEAAAEALGLSLWTARAWLRDAKLQTSAKPSEASATFRPIELVADEAARKVTLHGPCGIRVEGLTLAEVAELVRSLV